MYAFTSLNLVAIGSALAVPLPMHPEIRQFTANAMLKPMSETIPASMTASTMMPSIMTTSSMMTSTMTSSMPENTPSGDSSTADGLLPGIGIDLPGIDLSVGIKGREVKPGITVATAETDINIKKPETFNFGTGANVQTRGDNSGIGKASVDGQTSAADADMDIGATTARVQKRQRRRTNLMLGESNINLGLNEDTGSVNIDLGGANANLKDHRTNPSVDINLGDTSVHSDDDFALKLESGAANTNVHKREDSNVGVGGTSASVGLGGIDSSVDLSLGKTTAIAH